MRRFPVLLAAVSLLGGACGSGAGSESETETTSAAASGPGSLAVVPDHAAAVTAEIGPDGGELTAISGGGVTFTLDVPPGALLSPVAITMTPADASGEPIGESRVVAVHLAPEGQHFLRPVTITAAGHAIGDPVGIGSTGDGGDFHLLPVSDDAVLTTHFSLVGFGSREQLIELVDTYQPGTVATAASTAITVALALGDVAAAVAVLTAWGQEVQGGVAAATGSESLEQATVDMLEFFLYLDVALSEHARHAAGTEAPAELTDLAGRILNLWFESVDADVTRLRPFCAQDVASGFRVYRWVLIGAAITDLLGVDRAEILSRWADQASECLTFGVAWAAAVGLDDHEPPTSQALTIAQVSAEFRDLVRYDPEAAAVISEPFFVESDYLVDEFEWEACTPIVSNGRASIGLGLTVVLDNPPSLRSAELTEFVVAVDAHDPPTIQCQLEPGAPVPRTDWAGWFYALPLALMNADRLMPEPRPRSAWQFVIPVTSPTGVMGEFEVSEERTENRTTATVVQEIAVVHLGS